jgi:hypothetical protein
MQRPKRRPRTAKCQRCKAKIKVQPKGRVPKFCSRNCRQRAYEHNRALGPTMVPMSILARDLDTAHVRAVIRDEIRTVLREMGWGIPPTPPSPKPKRKAHLHVVEPS